MITRICRSFGAAFALAAALVVALPAQAFSPAPTFAATTATTNMVVINAAITTAAIAAAAEDQADADASELMLDRWSVAASESDILATCEEEYSGGRCARMWEAVQRGFAEGYLEETARDEVENQRYSCLADAYVPDEMCEEEYQAYRVAAVEGYFASDVDEASLQSCLEDALVSDLCQGVYEHKQTMDNMLMIFMVVGVVLVTLALVFVARA